MHIAIVDPLGSPYDGSTPSKRALGGSESAVVFIARELVKLGIRVDVYCHCDKMDANMGTYDGVEYRQYDMIEEYKDWYDLVIVSRSVMPWMNGRCVYGSKEVLWMHDTFCEGDEHLEALTVQGTIDEIWTLSDWHTSYISQCTHGHRRMMEVLKRKIWVTRNGVNVYRDVDIQKKDPNSFVFNAAVNKGMETLLNDIWPDIIANIPKAKLTIIGGCYPLERVDDQYTKLHELIDAHHEKNNVFFTGLIRQEQVADVLASASFMIYPQTLPETYGISTVESLAYGTPVISGRFGAMEETAIEDACYLMDYPVDSNVLYTFDKNQHSQQFVQMAIGAYMDRYLWQQKANAGLRVREVCGWDKVALQWKQHMCQLTEEYLPVDEYRRVQQINHRTHDIFNKRWSNPGEWAYYPESENRIEIVVPFYNASQWLSKCVESIKTQDYENYHVWLVDDNSSDHSLELAADLADDKFSVISNDEKVGALENQLDIICDHMKDDPIVMLIDGDDALANDPNVFKKINQLYHEGAEFTYGSCWSVVDGIPLIAQEYPKEIIESKSFKDHKFAWTIPYTHLRTFKRSLLGRVDFDDLRDDNGDYFRASGDMALFYALIEQCSPHGIKVLRDVVYIYNDAHDNNDYKINQPEMIKNQATIMDRREAQKALEETTVYHLPNREGKKVLIAIPTAQNIHPETFKSIYDQKLPKGYTAYFQYFYGYCIDQVRNLVVDFAINNKFDYLFFVDYDISFNQFTLQKLLEANVDIVTGMYIQRKPGEHTLEIYRKTICGHDYNVPIEDLPYGELLPINGCGLGCCLIKTDVLKEVGYPQFTYHHAIDARNAISEDIDFCHKAEAKGFNIYVDTSIECKHHGQTTFEVRR